MIYHFPLNIFFINIYDKRPFDSSADIVNLLEHGATVGNVDIKKGLITTHQYKSPSNFVYTLNYTLNDFKKHIYSKQGNFILVKNDMPPDDYELIFNCIFTENIPLAIAAARCHLIDNVFNWDEEAQRYFIYKSNFPVLANLRVNGGSVNDWITEEGLLSLVNQL